MTEVVRLSELPNEELTLVQEIHSGSDEFRVSLSSDLPQHQEFKEVEALIKTLQEQRDELLGKNPMLRGLAPLYQDYEAQFYYFEVMQFIVTLFIVAVAVCLPSSLNFLSSSPSFSNYEQMSICLLYLGVPSCQFCIGRFFG
jgi:hypothetical protein